MAAIQVPYLDEPTVLWLGERPLFQDAQFFKSEFSGVAQDLNMNLVLIACPLHATSRKNVNGEWEVLPHHLHAYAVNSETREGHVLNIYYESDRRTRSDPLTLGRSNPEVKPISEKQVRKTVRNFKYIFPDMP